MAGEPDTDLGGFVADLAGLLVRASPGPLEIDRPVRGWSTVVNDRQRVVATFAREADAELFIRALPNLRTAAAALVEMLGLHRDAGGGVCAQDGQALPCRTRQAFSAQLSSRAAAS